jgi:hypothetical protein
VEAVVVDEWVVALGDWVNGSVDVSEVVIANLPVFRGLSGLSGGKNAELTRGGVLHIGETTDGMSHDTSWH